MTKSGFKISVKNMIYQLVQFAPGRKILTKSLLIVSKRAKSEKECVSPNTKMLSLPCCTGLKICDPEIIPHHFPRVFSKQRLSCKYIILCLMDTYSVIVGK